MEELPVPMGDQIPRTRLPFRETLLQSCDLCFITLQLVVEREQCPPAVRADERFVHQATTSLTASLNPSGSNTSASAPYCSTSRTNHAGSATLNVTTYRPSFCSRPSGYRSLSQR